jgi:hypothetical protein
VRPRAGRATNKSRDGHTDKEQSEAPTQKIERRRMHDNCPLRLQPFDAVVLLAVSLCV